MIIFKTRKGGKAVLVAIAIPIFTTQLEKSREATDMANIRSAYAEVTAAYLEAATAKSAAVTLKSNTTNWKSDDDAEVAGVKGKTIIGSDSSAKTSIAVAMDADGNVTIGGQPATSTQLDSE